MRSSFRNLVASLFPILTLVVLLPPAKAERRALVIGNAAYADAPLKNPVNDARAIEARLKALDFTTTRVENLKRDQIGSTISGFTSTIRPGDEVVLFYAGHGLQVDGQNYFPAVDAKIETEDDVMLNSLNLQSLVRHIESAKAAVTLLFLDACRSNTFGRSFRGGEIGLARFPEAPSGTLIQYATRPGSVASDGAREHGLYTEQLLAALSLANEPVEQTMKRVATAVKKASNGKQDPWIEGHLDGDFCFAGCGAASPPSAPALGPTSGSNIDQDEELWQAVKDSKDAADFQNYLSNFRHGRHVIVAQQKIKNLTVQVATAPAAAVPLQKDTLQSVPLPVTKESHGAAPMPDPSITHSAVAAVARPPSEAEKVHEPELFSSVGADLVRDSRTGLVWTKSDNGSDINWEQADSYCTNLGMKLPTIAQIQALVVRDPAMHSACGDRTCKVSTQFRLTGSRFWSDNIQRAEWILANSVNLESGRSTEFFANLPTGMRALCVRGG